MPDGSAVILPAFQPAPAQDSVVLALARQQDQHITPFEAALSLPLIVDESWEPDVFDRYDVSLLLTLSNDLWAADRCLREAKRRGIPSLFLLDGVLEFRHQWTHPWFAARGGAPFLMPVLADKIACKGWNDARRLESWGNHGKCEVVGVPRFDRYLPPRLCPRRSAGKRRILVASARRPWFSDEQRSAVVQSFARLREFAETRSDIEFVWRVRKGLDWRLHLPANGRDSQHEPLEELLGQVDAVITQPSTLQLEAMLFGLPVALLDFANVPHFEPAAWRITAESQIGDTVEGLLHPSPARLSYQDECLNSSLSCLSPATPRMVKLIEDMIALGRDARARRLPLRFPDFMLPGESSPPVSLHLDLERQYKDHPTFGNKDLLDLQRRLAMLGRELDDARERLRRRSLGYWIENGCGWITKRVMETCRGRTAANGRRA